MKGTWARCLSARQAGVSLVYCNYADNMSTRIVQIVEQTRRGKSSGPNLSEELQKGHGLAISVIDAAVSGARCQKGNLVEIRL